MLARHRQRLFLVWLLLSTLLTIILFSSSQSELLDAVEERVSEHLQLTLDESHFSSAQNRVNDHRALQHIGQQINAAMQGLVGNRWYAAQKSCVVRLQSVDEVVIDDGQIPQNMVFGLLRNQIRRQVTAGLSCAPDWWVAAGLSAFLGLLFALITFSFPPPLAKSHRRWINYLLECGYSGSRAFEIVRAYDASRLILSAAQLACLEHLHDSERQNFAEVLAVVTDSRMAALSDEDVDWFLLGLESTRGSVEGALNLVSAEDSVEIDLNNMTLLVRGLDIPMSRTPLFYYAWYGMSRSKGDGWASNPASNRPDVAVGQELADLMSKFGGHAKAINDLEQTGLKARTLDQNRSKIKEELVAVLGEKLAGTYLFETSKHADGIHTQYRLHMDSQHIHIIM